MKPLLILAILLGLTSLAEAQEKAIYNNNYYLKNVLKYEETPVYFDFSALDSRMRTNTFGYNTSQKLAYQLTKEYDTEIEKVRAIYIWITDNIAYDCKKYHKKEKREKIECGSSVDCAQLFKEQIDKEIKKTLSSREGICEDYARLFARLCELNDIEAGYIAGKVKNSLKTLGRLPRSSNHAWNWAKIDGKVYLFDATFGSGTTDDDVTTFTKSYNELYFMVLPEKMAETHFPEEDKDQFKYPYTSLETFETYPIFHTMSKFLKIDIASPSASYIELAEGEKIDFDFTLDKRITEVMLTYEGAESPTSFEKTKDGRFVLSLSFEKKIPKSVTIGVRLDNDITGDLMTYRLKKVVRN